MKQRILNMLVALTAMVGSASAQTLSVASIEAEAGAQAELVVTGASLGSQTALQFNLSLPEGITLNETAITRGTAANGHELSVSTLSSGDRLFVLYDMNLETIQNGELLRLPVTIGQNATSGNAQLSTVRFASNEAVSTAGTNVSFTITVKAPAALKCATPVLTFASGKVKCTCATAGVTYRYTVAPTAATGESTTGEISFGTTFTISVKAVRDGYEDSDAATLTIPMAAVGDVNADGNVTIADVTALVNIILGK